MHKLLARQLRAVTQTGTADIDVQALLAIVDEAHQEFDRERRLNDRAARLMEEELGDANRQAQRDHDAILAATLSSASDGIVVTRADGVVETANPSAEAQFGAPPGGLAGAEIGALLGRAASRTVTGKSLSGSTRETAATTLGGKTFPAEFSSSMIEGSVPQRRLWIVRDISERVRAQREILENRLRFQDFAEASSDCFWEMDESLSQVDPRFASESDLAARLGELLTPGSGGAPHPDMDERVWMALRKAFASRLPFRDMRLVVSRHRDDVQHLSISGKPIFDFDGRFRGFRGTGRDVTREVLAREAAQRAERRLVEAIDAAPSAIAIVDVRGNLVGGNSALMTLAPHAIDLLSPGRSFALFLARALSSASRRGSSADFLRELTDKGEVREVEIAGTWYLAIARKLSDGGAILTFSDVTAMKQREQELAQAKLAAESANQLKSQFLATMSHELRTPLNAILGFSEVIRDKVFGAGEDAWTKYVDYAASIHASGRHLLSLISEILDLSKIEAGSYVLDVVEVDLRTILEASCTMIAAAAEKGGVAVRIRMPDDPVMVWGDERALRQITLNLLANAVKFTPQGGSITGELGMASGNAVLTVTDTGIGIAPEHIDAVFEPFRQVDSGMQRRHEGTGLGLAITKRLIELHGGTIALQSEVGSGTLVMIRLPQSKAGGRKGDILSSAVA